ncbi:MAG: glycosyltransferase [Candidatus Thorarchaeota archaeon]|jgi:hypothetical protein
MKILHISHGGLPDPRIERMALTMKKEGHKLIFLGGGEVKGQHLSAFAHTRTEPLGIGISITHNPLVRRRWLNVIDRIKPDIIHAHNVITGHFLLDTEYPAILDDHELLSAQSFVYMARPFIRRTAARTLVWKFPIWERKLAERFPIITVSEGMARYYRKYSKRINVVINVPHLSEVEWVTDSPSREGLVYMGSDFSWPRFSPWRDMTGLKNIIDFKIVSGLPHKEMMIELTKHTIGLIPYLPHPYQRLSSPNKMYEYLHAGLQVVLNAHCVDLFDGNPYIHPFNDYSDIVETINSVPQTDPSEIMAYSRENYVWEQQEDIIRKAYSQAVSH